MKAKLPRAQALALAGNLIASLGPYCLRLEIAGSLRRGHPEVGDIELVAIPRYDELPTDLFGERSERFSQLDAAIRVANLPRIRGGERYQQYALGPCCLDLFIAEPRNWGLIFLIRTGSADFSRWIVSRYGGAMPETMHVAGGMLWRGMTPIPTPEEADVFAALGLPFIPPDQRERGRWG